MQYLREVVELQRARVHILRRPIVLERKPAAWLSEAEVKVTGLSWKRLCHSSYRIQRHSAGAATSLPRGSRGFVVFAIGHGSLTYNDWTRQGTLLILQSRARSLLAPIFTRAVVHVLQYTLSYMHTLIINA